MSTAITVKEQDHEYVDVGNPGQGIAEEVIHGSIGVKVNPIAEPDGQLLVENAGRVTQTVQADANGKIDFTINDASGGQAGANVIRFDNLDSNTAGSYQSAELVDQLVVSFGNVPQAVLNQLLITGASTMVMAHGQSPTKPISASKRLTVWRTTIITTQITTVSMTSRSPSPLKSMTEVKTAAKRKSPSR